jgi:hypothetical protein
MQADKGLTRFPAIRGICELRYSRHGGTVVPAIGANEHLVHVKYTG